jgi:hypothetical protein
MRTTFLASLASLASMLLASTACVDDAHFDVKTEPGLQKQTVSVLGVFKEGRLSPEAWDDIGTKISPVFGKGQCPIGYDTKLVTDKPNLAEAVDDYTRANGVTDDLLDQLAPAAGGDSVLVITVAGRPLKHKNDTNTQMAPPTGMQSQRNGQMRGGRGGGALPPPSMGRMAVDTNAYEMSASLFSLRDHHSVALVSMGYGGESADEALAKFVEKLQKTFTGFPCVGWHMDVAIDDKKIHAMQSE